MVNQQNNAKSTKKHIDDFKKGQIKALYHRGCSYSTIGDELQLSKSTVGCLIKKYKDTGNFETKKRSGRPKKYTDVEAKSISREVQRNRFISVKEIQNCCNVKHLSEKTIRTIIQQHGGFTSYWACRKPFISKKNRSKRIAWARAHLHWTREQWRSVLWTDESPFVLRYRGKKRVWRLQNERYKNRCLITSVKHDKKINVWGAFSAQGLGILHRIHGIMDKFVFNNILETCALPSIHMLFGDENPPNYIFQQDNDPKHTAIINREWIEDNNVPTFEWPANSPDLNPIENLWSILDRDLMSRTPNNEEELFDVLQEAWKRIPIQTLEDLVDSMPRRCQAVIDSNGNTTKY